MESVTISKCNLEIYILLAKIVIHQCLGERHCCSLCLGLGPTCCRVTRAVIIGSGTILNTICYCCSLPMFSGRHIWGL